MGKSPNEKAASILQERINGLNSQVLPADMENASRSLQGFGSFASGVLFVQEREDPKSPSEKFIKREPASTLPDYRTAPNSPNHYRSPLMPTAVSVPMVKPKPEFRRSRSRSCGSLMEMLGDLPLQTGDAEVHHFGELRLRKHAVENA